MWLDGVIALLSILGGASTLISIVAVPLYTPLAIDKGFQFSKHILARNCCHLVLFETQSHYVEFTM